VADQTKTIGSGQDYATPALWEADSDVSTGFWKGTIEDTTAYGEVTFSGATGTPTINNYVWLTSATGNRHSGVAGTGHARIEGTPGTPAALLTINENFTRIDYLQIKLTGSGSSDEAIRIQSNTSGVLISSNIIYSTGTGASQDGIYTGNWACSGCIDNNIIYGFDRAGFHLQNYTGSATQTWNADLNTLYNNGGGAANEGNISVDADGTSTVNINVYNNACGSGGGEDFRAVAGTGTINWAGTHNACSDTSLTSRGLTTGAQESLTVTATTQSSGSYMVFKNITGGSEDLQMLDEAAGNLLSDNGTNRVGSEPDARQDFSLDIVGNTRGTTSPSPDIGASEILAAVSAALSGTATASITESDVVTGGKTIILTLTGDTWVTAGATFDAQRQNIIDGIDSAQAEAAGWDATWKVNEGVTAVVRTSNTVVTVTMTAESGYDITAQETITATIPATALTTSVSAVVASPTFTVDFVSTGITVFRRRIEARAV